MGSQVQDALHGGDRCFESTFENDGLQPLGHQLSPRHFESEDVEATVSIKSNPRRSISMPPRSRKVSSKKSMSRISEEEMLELYKMSFGGGGARKEEQKREEEELRKKMTRKPSRKDAPGPLEDWKINVFSFCRPK